MESLISSDESCDQEIKTLKSQLNEYGLEEDYLSKNEMNDILKALKNSKESNNEEQKKAKENLSLVTMKRKYLNVRDRRMPWSLMPQTLEPAERARTLAVYMKLMSINNYRQARQSVNMAAWPPPIQIIESTRILPQRSTRSGRIVPVYTDDDSSDCPKKSFNLKRKMYKDENMRIIKEVKLKKVQKLALEGHEHTDLFSIVED